MVAGPAAALPGDFVRALRGLPPLAVAFSGGLDSRFLCHAARLCGCDVLALHARGPHIPAQESAWAAQWANAAGLPLLMLDFDPLSLPEVARNSRQRCYDCKKGLIAALRAALSKRRAREGGDRLLCDGSNADDLHAFRPGLRALAEARVRSPLAEAGLGKAAIRSLAGSTGLVWPEQQARPCLLTRLAYGLSPDAALLERLAGLEAALAQLPAPDEGGPALGDFRLRLRPAPLLQVTRLPAALRPQVEEILAAHGFAPCQIAETGGVSGFFDAPPRVLHEHKPGLDFTAERV